MVILGIMKQLKLFFKIITENNCPLYDQGDLLSLSDKALSCPEDKPTCLILVREMTSILFDILETGFKSHETSEKLFNCSGCSGLIKFKLMSKAEVHRNALALSTPSLSSPDKTLLAEIKEFPLIQALPDAELNNVLSNFRKEHLSANSKLITKGQHNLYLYIVLSGNIEVTDSSLPIASLQRGDICGEMSYLGGEIASADVICTTEAEVLSVPGNAFSALIDRIPELQLFMAKILVKRLAHSNTSKLDTFDATMSGQICEMPPAELFQIFHMNQKTGVLTLELQLEPAKISFREGCIVGAQYGKETNQDAIFSILKETEGRYVFSSGLPTEDMQAEEIGDFMMLLMEGIKRIDEEG